MCITRRQRRSRSARDSAESQQRRSRQPLAVRFRSRKSGPELLIDRQARMVRGTSSGPPVRRARGVEELRVIQWTTGKVGKLSLRGVIDDPRLELVGVFAYSEDKAGVDAGPLCGRPDTG